MKAQHFSAMLALPFAASVLGAGGAAAAPSACDAIAGNLVANCGFELTTVWSGEYQDNSNPHTGNFADAILYSGTLEQTIPTLTDETYTLTFWAIAAVPSDAPFDPTLDVSFGGTSVLTTPTLTSSTYDEFTTTVTASSTSSVLEFDVNSDGYGYIDDVSLVPAPEPASVALFATGLAGLAGLRRRRR